MNRIDEIKNRHKLSLEKQCQKNGISFSSIEKLLEAEKTRKLLKRNAHIQHTIDMEIENTLENEN